MLQALNAQLAGLHLVPPPPYLLQGAGADDGGLLDDMGGGVMHVQGCSIDCSSPSRVLDLAYLNNLGCTNRACPVSAPMDMMFFRGGPTPLSVAGVPCWAAPAQRGTTPHTACTSRVSNIAGLTRSPAQ